MKKVPLFFRLVVCFLAFGVIGVALLTAVYALPVEPMAERVRGSIPIFEEEGASFRLVPARISTSLNTQSDALFLNIATTGNEGNPLDAAMRVEFTAYGEYSPTSSGKVQDLIQRYVGTEEPSYRLSYARYWHGYLVFLKPMLLFIEYGGIRLLNMALQTLLFAAVVYLAGRRVSGKYVFALALSIAALLLPVIALCMQYSVIYYLLMGALLAVLKIGPRLRERKRYLDFFFFIGMCANYFDLLTYPLVTLGLPLVALLLMLRPTEKEGVCISLGSGVVWALGFGGIWGIKWLLAQAVTGEHVLASATDAALLRSGTQGGGVIYRFRAIAEALKAYLCKPWFLLAAALFLLLVLLIAVGRLRIHSFRGKVPALALLGIGLIPFAWFFLFAEHTVYHPFPHRILAVTFFAWGSLLAAIIEKKKAGEAFPMDGRIPESTGNG